MNFAFIVNINMKVKLKTLLSGMAGRMKSDLTIGKIRPFKHINYYYLPLRKERQK